jgi:plastocyanin
MCAPISCTFSSTAPTYDVPVTRGGVLLAGLLLALAALVPGAQAATRTVHLTNDGPRPASLTLRAGDAVQFVNDDTVPHQVRSQGGWQYDSGPVPPGQSSSVTPRLTAPGTYRYTDLRGIVFLPQTFAGSLVVPAPKPPPKPAPRPTATRAPAASPSPAPAASTPPPQQSPTPAPPVSPGPTPPPVPRPTGAVVPPPTPGATPSPSPTAAPALLYGEPRALTQPSPHRYGLPAVLAGVAIGGVLSLLGRYLLAQPEGRRT